MRSFFEPDGAGGGAEGECWPRHASEHLRVAGGVDPGEARPLVMIVDDDSTTGEMYGAGLEMAGFDVTVLNDACAFFNAIELDTPDFVVLDFELGGMITGVMLLENLRLDARAAEIPVFILSNHLGDLDGQIDRAFGAGAMAWLVKSKTSPPELAVRISEALASARG